MFDEAFLMGFESEMSKIAQNDEDKGISIGGHLGAGALAGTAAGAGHGLYRVHTKMPEIMKDVRKAYQAPEYKGMQRPTPRFIKGVAYPTGAISGGLLGAGAGALGGLGVYGIRRLMGAKKKGEK